MKHKVMVRTDVEGVSGVVSYEQAEPGKPEYAFGQRMFMSDLRALLDGLHEGGAEEIVVYDEHYYGRNIDLADMPPYAAAICGKPPYRADWPGGLDATFTAMVLLGYHAKAGTDRAVLPHSYELEIRDLVLNGVSVGEIGIEGAIAGDLDIPTVMIVGDGGGVAEAEKLLPGIIAVAVKEPLSSSGALCYPSAVTADKIRSAAIDAMRNPPPVQPYRAGPNVTLQVVLSHTPFLKAMRTLHSDQMTKDNTVELRGASAADVWGQYWHLKLSCQRSIQNVNEA